MILKDAVKACIANKGAKSHRWLAADLAKEAFSKAHALFPKENAFVLEGFNIKTGKPEANEDQKNALLDAWNELRYEEQREFPEDSDKEPRQNNYSQISGFILRSADGETVEQTRGAREEKTDDGSVINYIRFYGKPKDSYKEFRRALKFTIMSQMARDYNGQTKFGEKMKGEYLAAIKNAEDYFAKLSPREKFALTLLPEPLRETIQMKAKGLDTTGVRIKNEEALKKYDAEGAPDVSEDEEEEETEETEEESYSVEDLQARIDDLKEESKDASKKRKDEIKLEIKAIEEEIANFQELAANKKAALNHQSPRTPVRLKRLSGGFALGDG